VSEDTIMKPDISIDIEKERIKPRLVALLFCEYGNTSSDGKLNISGIFDRIHIEPNHKHRFFMFIQVAETFSMLELQLFRPDGKIDGGALLQPLVEKECNPTNINYLQALIRFDLEVTQEGIYWYRVLHKGEDLGGNGIKVEFKKNKQTPENGENHGDLDI
jgi:hypothetical protein